MGVVINVNPTLNYKPVWLVGEIDFDVEMTHQHLVQTSTGMRGGAAKEFEREWQWAVDEFIRRMEQKGHIYVGLPNDVPLRDGQVKWGEGVIAEGPFLPYDYSQHWPTAGEDGEEVSRKAPRSLEDTKGRVCYRMAAVFLVKEHVLRQIVEYDKQPEAYKAAKNAKKVNGLWEPQPVAAKQYYEMGATR